MLLFLSCIVGRVHKPKNVRMQSTPVPMTLPFRMAGAGKAKILSLQNYLDTLLTLYGWVMINIF